MAKLSIILKSECANTGNFCTHCEKSCDDDLAIKKHLFCNDTPDFEDFSILTTNNNDIKVTLMESLLINRDYPPLNKNKQSLPLELFDS